jgi:hypothetical protein
MGPSFTTRLAVDGGLTLPQDIAAYRYYICEACVVRSVIEEELNLTPHTTVLLMLERARFIDLTNHWAKGTLKTYGSKFNVLIGFSQELEVPVCVPRPLDRPPFGKAIKIMWAQERYSLFPTDWHRRNARRETTVSYGSVRAICAAASHFWIWDLFVSHPERLTLGYKKRPLLVEGFSPTDETMCMFFTHGMKRRLGDHPKPSAVLLVEHVIWINKHLDERFLAAPTDAIKIETCRIALTHATAYAGWLRAMETFGIRWEDLDMYLPDEGPMVGLPIGVGVLLLRLLEQTKSSQDKCVDVILAFGTASGINLLADGTYAFGVCYLRLNVNRTPSS